MRQHPTKWTVLYLNGHRTHHASREAALEAVWFSATAIGITPPLYRHE